MVTSSPKKGFVLFSCFTQKFMICSMFFRNFIDEGAAQMSLVIPITFLVILPLIKFIKLFKTTVTPIRITKRGNRRNTVEIFLITFPFPVTVT